MKASLLQFLSATPDPEGARALILGLPWDGTASYRSGSRFAPDAIRRASDSIESYDPHLDEDLEGFGAFCDLGDLRELPARPGPAHEAMAAGLEGLPLAPLLGLGGEHSITPVLVQRALRLHPDLAVVVVDAHADLREEYEGTPHSHACSTRRLLELVGPQRLGLVGVRSGTREEYELIRRHKLLAAPGAESFPALLERFGDRPVYLSVDVDGFDPALVPGTGTVEPGGLGWADFEALAALLRRRRVVGADLVELAPDLDPTGRSEVVAARIVRLLLLLLLGTGQAGDLARNE